MVPVPVVSAGPELAYRLRHARCQAVVYDAERTVLVEEALVDVDHDVSRFEVSALTRVASDAVPYPVQSSSQVVTCDNETDRVITGRLRRVELEGCQRIELRDATLERLIVVDSEVSLVNVSIHAARGAALSSRGSTVVATGGSIAGEVGMELDDSRLDLAGVAIRATRHPILVREPSHALFSACSGQGPSGRIHVHGEVELSAE